MTVERQRRFESLRTRTTGTTVAASSGRAAVTWTVAGAALVLAWLATLVAGGTQTVLPHAMYIPVILVALRFGALGALIVSVVGGIALGPFMPLDVGAGIPQETPNWVARLLTFTVIGQMTAYLSRHSLPSLTEELAARRFRRELDEAVGTSQLHLVYQPIVDLRTGALAGAEALVRWEHPVRGAVMPDAFIGEAERLGCIGQITRVVLATACEQLAAWRAAGLVDGGCSPGGEGGGASQRDVRGGEGFTLSINVSAVDLVDEGLAEAIAADLRRTGVPPGCLHLEITETALVDDVDGVVERLRSLRALGVGLAIDDFGTGESSLGHLQRFAVDVLKLDAAFLARMEDDHRGHVIARSMVGLADALGLTTVAEGIETPAQAALVRDVGCELGQGYLFARPMPPADLQAILRDPDHFRDVTAAAICPKTLTPGRLMPGR